MLLRRSSRILFALLCVLVLTRMPLVCVAEESSSPSVNIEEGAALDADVTSSVAKSVLSPLLNLSTFHLDTSAHETNTRSIEFAILRL